MMEIAINYTVAGRLSLQPDRSAKVLSNSRFVPPMRQSAREVPLLRHLQFGRSLFWLVCASGFASPVWAQEQSPVGPAPAAAEPAPSPAPPPAAQSSFVPEPGSALAALLAGPSAAAPAHPPPAGEQPKRSGFVVGASLGVHVILAGAENPQPALQPGLAVGAKLGRVVLTLGAEFTSLSASTTTESRSNGARSTMNRTSSAFLVVPGAQVAIVRSRDGRVELLGAVRFGFGAPISNTTLDPAPPPQMSTLNTTRFSFMYELGPGVRYWPHRHFALNLLAGFRGDYVFENTTGRFPMDPSVTSVTTVNDNGLNGLFASLGGMGSF